MEVSSASKLARLWADAVPLYKFVSERAKQISRNAAIPSNPPAETATGAPIRTRSRSMAASTQAEVIAHSLRSINAAFQERAAFDRAAADMINDLIAGRLTCLGRRPMSFEFERIDPSFWIGAKADWYANAVSRDDTAMIDVRVTTTPLNELVQPQVQQGPGRPSRRDVIRAAIADYAIKDPALSRPPGERYRAYRSYISDHGYNLRTDSGFSGKTFEKYEREFRSKNK